MSTAVAFAGDRPNRPRTSEQAAFVAVVEADMRGQATPMETEMLRSPGNLARWLRVLRRMLRETEIHSRKDKLALKTLIGERVASGVEPGRLALDPAYQAAKAHANDRARSRLHFTTHVQTRIEEVVSLIGAAGLTPVSLGQVVDSLVEIEDTLWQGDSKNAARMLTSMINRYERLEFEV